VTLAANGRIAWDFLADNSNKFAFAVIDVIMPEMDGLELL
jgi:CheY-like chemotaxis protein